MKRIIAILLVAAMITATFCGCSKKDDSGVTKIVIWHDKEDQVAQVVQDALKVLEPDIEVEMVKKDGLTDALKLVGNDPESAPDMVFFAHDKIGVYAEMGILSPITDFVSQDVLDNYLDETLEAASYKGTLYQLPIYYETLLFMYNKALMTKDQVPATTEDLYNYMKANTTGDSYGFVEQHSTAYYSIPWIHGFGGELVSEDGQPLLNTDQVKKALEYHLKFLEFMPGESEYSTVNTLFLEGLAASTIGGPWLVPTAKEKGIDLGYATMPVVNETGFPLSPYMGVQGMYVLKVAADEKSDEIKKVLDILSDKQIAINMAKTCACAPANSLAYEDKDVKSNEMIMVMKDIASTAVATPNIPEMDVMFTMAGNLLVEVNMKGTSVSDAVDTYQGKAETLIENMK